MIDKESDAFEQQQAHCSHVRADQAVVARSGPAMLDTFQYTVSSNGNDNDNANANSQLNLAPSAGRGLGAIKRTRFRGQECKRLYF
jgi:hypothetical protein